MFDLAFSELFVIVIVALIVIGPERLPKAARFAALTVRRARAQWYSVKSELEDELSDSELKRTLRETRDDLNAARDSVLHSGQEVQREFSEFGEAARAWNEPQPDTGTTDDAAEDAAVDAAAGPGERAHDVEATLEPRDAHDVEATPEPRDADGRRAPATGAAVDPQR